MKLEEQDRIIAEELGWKLCNFDGFEDCTGPEMAMGFDADVDVWKSPEGKYVRHGPPKYSTDLEAIHAAVRTLSMEQQTEYGEILCTICLKGNYDCIIEEDIWANALTATAEQCSEAFLKRIGKWK